MNVVVAGDSHGSITYCDMLIRQAKDHDCDWIVVVGDFGYFPHFAWGVEFLQKLERRLSLAGKKLLFLRGNHDNAKAARQIVARDDEGFTVITQHIRFVDDGHRWTWAGVRFLAFGGAYSTDKADRLKDEAEAARKIKVANAHRIAAGQPGRVRNDDTRGTLWFPEEEAPQETVDRILADRSRVDIMLTHDKPIQSNGPGKNEYPCIPNQRNIQKMVAQLKPKSLLHGHLHVSYVDKLSWWEGTERGETTVMGLGCNVAYVEESFIICELEHLHEKFSTLRA